MDMRGVFIATAIILGAILLMILGSIYVIGLIFYGTELPVLGLALGLWALCKRLRARLAG